MHKTCMLQSHFTTHLQASVCRAYQIFKSHGVPDENIVVMMFDDIAYNSQ